MSPIWQKRAFRAWLVVLLPLAMFFAYRAISAHLDAQGAREAASHWHQIDLQQEREGIPKGYFSIDPREQVQSSFQWESDALERRSNSILWAAIILTLPLAAYIGLLVTSWVWQIQEAPDTSDKKSIGGEPQPKRIRSFRKALLAGIPATIAVGTMFVFAPQKTATILVATLVQAVALIFIVWIIRIFKR